MVKSGFGFGAERLGILTLRFPSTMAIAIIFLSAILGFALPKLQFEGDVLRLMDQSTQSWKDFETISADFPTAMPDLFVLASSDSRPPSPEWLQRLHDLHLDLQLFDYVTSVQSLNTLQKPDGSGGTQPLFDPFSDTLSSSRVLSLATENPVVSLFFRPELGLSLMSLSLRDAHVTDTAETARRIIEISERVAISGLKAEIGGRSASQVEVANVIQRDLTKMVLLSVLFGWSITFLIFNDIRAVLITNLVSPVAMIWTAGAYAGLGISLDAATVILPLLAAIIAFADAVHVVLPLQRRLKKGERPKEAIIAVIRVVGPATALTSMTTALAFGSLVLAGTGLLNMAIMGVVAVILAWIAVMTLCPLLCLLVGGRGLGETRLNSFLDASGAWQLVHRAINFRTGVVTMSLLVAVVLIIAQAQFRSVHQPAAYFAADSTFIEVENKVNASFSGNTNLLVRVPLPVGENSSSHLNLERLAQWHDAISDEVDPASVWSRARLNRDLAAALPNNAGDLSPDGRFGMIAVRHHWPISDGETAALKATIERSIETLPGQNEVLISGIAVVTSEGTKTNIDRLRWGLFLSAGLTAGLVAIASGSIAAGVGTGLAVLLSILLVLTFGSWPDSTVGYGLVVALIVSVGIAIDDGIHLVNFAQQDAHFGSDAQRAYSNAVEKAGVAIVVSSIILIVSLFVTQFAEMPATRSIGREIMAALAVAMVLTLVVVPCAALSTRDLFVRLKGGTTK